jgi:hypothetical protein
VAAVLAAAAVTGGPVKGEDPVDIANHTYSQQHTEYSVTGGANAPWYQALDLWSSPSEVQQALQSGQAPQKGTTTVADGNPRPYVADWMPATPDDIAKAKDDPIPAGYTKVDKVG